MFGGLAFFQRGNLFTGIWKHQLIVRLAPEDANLAQFEPHVHPFDITGRPLRGWLLVDPAGVKKDGDLDDWLKRALAFIGTLPPRSKTPKRKTSKPRKRRA